MCFCGCTSNVTRFAQGPPKGYLGMKELDRTTEPIVPTCANAITCQHGPTLQFVSRAETDSLCGTDMMAFVWVPWCLCPGKSSSQGWRKIIVVQSTDLQSWVYICVFNHLVASYFDLRRMCESVFSTTLIYAGLPRKASLWNRLLQASVVFFCGCASNSQDSSKASPRAIFKWTNFIVNGDFPKMQEGAGANARHTVCILLYAHNISNWPTNKRASGALSIKKTTVLLDDRQKKHCLEPLKEKVVEARQAIEAMVPMNERWGRLSLLRYDEFNVPTVASIAVCQLCRERRVMTVWI